MSRRPYRGAEPKTYVPVLSTFKCQRCGFFRRDKRHRASCGPAKAETVRA